MEYFSRAGHKLIYEGTGCNVMTLDTSDRWVSVYHIINGEVVEISFNELDGLIREFESFDASVYCDHVVNPDALIEYCKISGTCLCFKSLEEVYRRWRIDYLGVPS